MLSFFNTIFLFDLFKCNSCASFFKFSFKFFSFVCRNVFLNNFWSAFNKSFCFAKTKSSDFSYNFDNSDFVCSDFSKFNIEFALFFSSWSSTSNWSSSYCNWSSSTYAKCFFKFFYKLTYFKNCHRFDFFN